MTKSVLWWKSSWYGKYMNISIYHCKYVWHIMWPDQTSPNNTLQFSICISVCQKNHLHRDIYIILVKLKAVLLHVKLTNNFQWHLEWYRMGVDFWTSSMILCFPCTLWFQMVLTIAILSPEVIHWEWEIYRMAGMSHPQKATESKEKDIASYISQES